MDRYTRKELKTDKFVAEFGRTVEFFEEHRKTSVIAGVALVVVVLGAIGFYYYSQSQHTARQDLLKTALRSFEADVNPGTAPAGVVVFPTLDEKNEAIQTQFNEVISKYPGSDEAVISEYYLGLAALNNGRTAEAERRLAAAKDAGVQPFSSQAAYSLAQLFEGLERGGEAEEIYRDLIENPTILVSKEQATISLANLLAKSDPAKARELLEPLRGERSTISRAALTALSNLPPE